MTYGFDSIMAIKECGICGNQARGDCSVCGKPVCATHAEAEAVNGEVVLYCPEHVKGG
jgi:hypothetical protein